LKLVIPTKKKLLQTKLRRTRISPPQMPGHDDQASLPIWRASGCPLEPAYHGDWWPAYYHGGGFGGTGLLLCRPEPSLAILHLSGLCAHCRRGL
jgi:hypothetical protein